METAISRKFEIAKSPPPHPHCHHLSYELRGFPSWLWLHLEGSIVGEEFELTLAECYVIYLET